MKKKSAQDAVPLASLGKALESRRILVLDDEQDILQAYKDILTPQSNVVALKSSRMKATQVEVKTEGFEIVAVSTGEAAVNEVKKAVAAGRPFAVGFFDVLLKTGIDGIETVKRIHEMDPEMYAVLVTAYQDRHVNAIQEVFGAEFEDRWDYLNKPFSEGEILQKARSMVSMWNVRQKSRAQQEALDELKSQMGEKEKAFTISAVARSVGHEFGNILLQIIGRADLSLKSNPEEMKKALEMILAASEQANKVLNRFKDLASTKKQEGLVKLQISKPVEDTLLLMHHELNRRSIITEVNMENLPEVNGDHSALIQVFMNLVINAAHAIKEDGKIIFNGRKLPNNAVEITVRDTGSGIPEKHMEEIFQTFFTTKGEHGSGLGLSVCKEIIEINHRGKITAANHPQGGAIFTLVLPVDGDGEDL